MGFGLLKVLAGPLIKGAIGVAVGSAFFFSATWIIGKIEDYGSMREQLVQANQSIGELSTRFETFNRILEERANEGHKLRSLFSDLRADAQEIKNACDGEPLAPDYVDQLRRAAEAATAGEGLPSAE